MTRAIALALALALDGCGSQAVSAASMMMTGSCMSHAHRDMSGIWASPLIIMQ
jgi:hypothetical protein